MKLRKKLMVWGAFFIMGLVITGCTEESYFDSAVAVEDTSSDGLGLGDGSGDSSVGNVHVVKNSASDAFLDLLNDSDKKGNDGDASSGGSNDNGSSNSGSGFDSVTLPGSSNTGGANGGTISGGGSSSGSGSVSRGAAGVVKRGSDYVYHDPYADGDDISFGPGTKQYEDDDGEIVDDPILDDDLPLDDEEEKPETPDKEDEDAKEPADKGDKEPQTENKPAEETPAEPAPEEKAPAEKTEPVSEPKTEEPEVKEQQVAKEEPVKQQPAEPEPAVEIPVNPEPEVTEEVSYDMVLTFLIMNESNVRYGMISMINPYTKEQVRIGALGANEMFAFTMNWPSSEKHFRLAVYDEAGNLVREENIDFHKVTAGCAVKLIGDGSLSDIISEIE